MLHHQVALPQLKQLFVSMEILFGISGRKKGFLVFHSDTELRLKDCVADLCQPPMKFKGDMIQGGEKVKRAEATGTCSGEQHRHFKPGTSHDWNTIYNT